MLRVSLVFVALGLLDLVRAVLPPTDVDVDSLSGGFAYRHVRVRGLPRLEAAQAYEVVTYRGPALISNIVDAKPWLLIPLSRPRDENSTLVVAEVSLPGGEVPPDFDPNALEFEGLAGPGLNDEAFRKALEEQDRLSRS